MKRRVGVGQTLGAKMVRDKLWGKKGGDLPPFFSCDLATY